MNLKSTAKLLPPEFYAVGLDHFEPWTPVDTLCILKLLDFHLSWNWGQDILREFVKNLSPELKSMVEEIIPFTSEYSHNLVTLMNEEDTK